MLEVDHIDAFYGEAQAVHGVSLYIAQGELVSLIGANGAGKSTVMSAILGLLRIKNGKITFNKERIDKLRPNERVRRGIILVPEGRKLFPEMTVLENLEMGAYHREARLQLKATSDYVFKIYPILQERRSQLAGTMSGGEQQMLAIGRGLMGLPKLLMLDEISLGLAPLLTKLSFGVVQALNSQGITIFLVEQNVKIALNISTRTYALKDGRIVMEGQSRELINSEEIKKTYLGVMDRNKA